MHLASQSEWWRRDAASVIGCQTDLTSQVESHRLALTRLACRMLGSADDAQDAVQETMLKAHRSIGQFDQSSRLSPWLFRLCLNCCTDQLRRRRSLRSHEVEADRITAEPHTRLNLGPGPEAAELLEALSALRHRDQELLILHHFHGMSIAELAELYAVPIGTLKSWMSRARHRLKEIFQA